MSSISFKERGRKNLRPVSKVLTKKGKVAVQREKLLVAGWAHVRAVSLLTKSRSFKLMLRVSILHLNGYRAISVDKDLK